jgi:hypothetical protein
MRRAVRAALGAAVVLATAAGLGACAQIPTSGPVLAGNADVDTQVDIAIVAQGPKPGVGPESIVSGFLGAAVAAATSPKEFETAREFLTEDVAETWDPEPAVRVIREAPLAELSRPGIEVEDADTVEVVVNATTIATLDSAGTYTEVGDPREVGYRFTLVRVGDEWRISVLDDGVIVPANLFANQYRATRLYFPAATDTKNLVPDLRWFPRRNWRSVAVEEMLAGPPEWLQGATQSLVPEGTQLSSASVRESDGEEVVAVRLSEQIASAAAQQRSVIAAQLSATFSEGAGRTVPVELYSGTSRLAVDAAAVHLPGTAGKALAVQDGDIRLVNDGLLEEYETTADLSAVSDPTALAVSPAGAPLVVRDGTDQILNLTDDGPVEMFAGSDLAAPSVDTFGFVWTSGRAGALRVAGELVDELSLKPEWLAGRKVISVSVSPEGSRVAVVSEAPSGTQVHVAGIVRDEEDTPADLTPPLSVAGPVDDIEEARWSGTTTLALLTRGADGTSGVWTAGVGGLAGTGGAARQLTGLTDVEQLAAGVTDQGILVITDGGHLEREETGVWQPFAEEVDLIGYPG